MILVFGFLFTLSSRLGGIFNFMGSFPAPTFIYLPSPGLMNLKVTQECSSTSAHPCPTYGSVGVARDSVSKAWNRALVLDLVEGDKVNVLFVDYGTLTKLELVQLCFCPLSL